jgi:hypothetical protein
MVPHLTTALTGRDAADVIGVVARLAQLAAAIEVGQLCDDEAPA